MNFQIRPYVVTLKYILPDEKSPREEKREVFAYTANDAITQLVVEIEVKFDRSPEIIKIEPKPPICPSCNHERIWHQLVSIYKNRFECSFITPHQKACLCDQDLYSDVERSCI